MPEDVPPCVNQKVESSPLAEPQPTAPTGSNTELKPRLGTEKLGNWSQIASAVASWVTVCIAIYGISVASPFFQNKLYSEKNAKLTIEDQDLTSKIQALRTDAWSMTCAIASSRIHDGLDIFQPGQVDLERLKLLGQSSTTFRIAMKDALSNAELEALDTDDQMNFRKFVQTYVSGLPKDYDIHANPGLGPVNNDQALDINAQADNFDKSCKSAAPTT